MSMFSGEFGAMGVARNNLDMAFLKSSSFAAFWADCCCRWFCCALVDDVVPCVFVDVTVRDSLYNSSSWPERKSRIRLLMSCVRVSLLLWVVGARMSCSYM